MACSCLMLPTPANIRLFADPALVVPKIAILRICRTVGGEEKDIYTREKWEVFYSELDGGFRVAIVRVPFLSHVVIGRYKELFIVAPQVAGAFGKEAHMEGRR